MGASVVTWEERAGVITVSRQFTSRSAAQAGLNALALVVESGFVPAVAAPGRCLDCAWDTPEEQARYHPAPVVEAVPVVVELTAEQEARMAAADPPEPIDVLNVDKGPRDGD